MNLILSPPVRCVTRMMPEVAAAPRCNRCFHPGKLRVLIVTGQYIPAHDWRVNTPVLHKLLEDSGRFNYGNGRVFVTALGHDTDAMKSAAFIATFTRGTEWAATAGVTIPLPDELK